MGGDVMETTEINNRLKELLSRDFIEQEIEIRKLSEESNITKATLTKQLEKYKQENLKQEDKDRNLSIEDLGLKIGQAMNKKQIAREILRVQPIYYDSAKNWWLWIYPKWKWQRVDETDILNAIDSATLINTINKTERTEIIEALKQVCRLNEPMQVNQTCIQFKDTIFDIKTGERFKASHEFFVTNPIPYELHEENFEQTPVMDKIFTE
jgi:hypothetical protein